MLLTYHNSCVVNSKPYSQEQLSLVLEDSSASEDEPIISSEEEEEDVADGEGDDKKKSKVAVASGKRCDSPDFHGFESWAAEAEYVKSLEGFRRDNSCRHKKR